MKNIYIRPAADVIALTTADVITLSGQKKADFDSDIKYNYYEIGDSFWSD